MKEKAYPGQKKIYGVYHKIINEIPPFASYYELFAGTAAIYKELKKQKGRIKRDDNTLYFLNDINKAVTAKLKVDNVNSFKSNWKALHIITEHILPEHTNSERTFVFIDPPYLHSTRPTNTKLYKNEMTDSDHKKLLMAVLQLECNCMIIHPKCVLYDRILKNWRKVEVKIRYNRKTSIECLYMNYKKPNALQSDDLLGDDCWDRQRIKRKAKRMVEKFVKLPVLERKFIMKRLILEFKNDK